MIVMTLIKSELYAKMSSNRLSLLFRLRNFKRDGGDVDDDDARCEREREREERAEGGGAEAEAVEGFAEYRIRVQIPFTLKVNRIPGNFDC